MNAKNTRKQVKFFCTEEEYSVMQKHAHSLNMTLSAYLRDAALTKGRIIYYNYDAIRKHTDEVMDIKSKLYPVVAILTATGQVLPTEVQHIVSCLDSLVESEKKLLDDNFKERNRMRKFIKNENKSAK